MTTGNDWLDQARRLVAGLGETLAAGPAAPADAGTGTGTGAPHGSDCRWCPLCQAAAMLRGERPELTVALADTLSAAAAALRLLAEPQQPPAGSADEQPAGGSATGPV